MLSHIEFKKALVLYCLCASIACGCVQTQSESTRTFVNWVSENALRIENLNSTAPAIDVEALKLAVGSARVVGLGESRHDTREQVLLKGLLVRNMIEELGFRAFVLEESCPHAEPLDRYVTTGEGELREIMNSLAGWYLWDTEEMLELFQWIRQFNKERAESDMVRVFGMDITAPAMAIMEVRNYLDEAIIESGIFDKDYGLNLHRGDFWPDIWRRYGELSREEIDALADQYQKLVDNLVVTRTDLVELSSEREYERALLFAEVAWAGNAFFSSSDVAQGGAIRESAMAETVLWYLEHEIPGERAVVWGHNLHVAKSTFSMSGEMEGTFSPMGIHLKDTLGKDYIAIGGTFGEGSYSANLPPGERHFEKLSTEAVDGALESVGLAQFLIDLRKAEENSEEGKWLRHEREWRAQDVNAFVVPVASFDLVYFVGDISRSQPTPMALDRFESMRN